MTTKKYFRAQNNGAIKVHSSEFMSKFDYFKSLGRPKRLTEEEIWISKQRMICLVCKVKLERNYNYLFPGCNTFYCLKCHEVLTYLENARCWVREAAFDESRLIKLTKLENEEVLIEDKEVK